MNKLVFKTFAMCLMSLMVLGAGSCSSEKKKSDKVAVKTEKKTKSKSDNLPNYRYVDSDTLLEKYNLAKDYQEEMLRLQNQYDAEARQQQQSLQALATQFQQKQQNNQYTSQEQVEKDARHYQQREQAAQSVMAKKQQDMAAQMGNAQKAVQDSIVKYIEEYNKVHGYDAIFMKAATLYINPDLDITEEILEGLNARYNKVKK